MTLAQYANLFEIVGGAIVVITLIFLLAFAITGCGLFGGGLKARAASYSNCSSCRRNAWPRSA